MRESHMLNPAIVQIVQLVVHRVLGLRQRVDNELSLPALVGEERPAEGL